MLQRQDEVESGCDRDKQKWSPAGTQTRTSGFQLVQGLDKVESIYYRDKTKLSPAATGTKKMESRWYPDQKKWSPPNTETRLSEVQLVQGLDKVESSWFMD